MLGLTMPGVGAGRGLKDKVQRIRRYAAAHELSLDHFEYVVPGERNSFAHSGIVEDPKLRSLEVLHDLAYVCEVFTELDAPIVEICNLLAEPTSLQDIRQWARLFELVDEVTKAGQRDELGTKLDDALATFLPSDDAKRQFAGLISERLRTDTTMTSDHLSASAKNRLGITLALGERRTREVHERIGELSDLINEIDTLSDGALLRPLDVRIFAKGVLDHVELPIDARAEIEQALRVVERPLNGLAGIIREAT